MIYNLIMLTIKNNKYNLIILLSICNIYYSIEELLVSAKNNSNYVIGVLNLKAIPVIKKQEKIRKE